MNLAVFAFLAIGLINTAFASDEITIDGLLAEIERVESEIKDVSAKFRQETRLPGTGERQVITGTFEIVKDQERFRIRYTSPVEQAVAFDGESLTMYFPETGQAFRQKTTLADIVRLVGINPSAPTRNMRDNFEAKLDGCNDKSCKILFSPKDGPKGAERRKSSLNWRVKVKRNTYLLEEAEMISDEIEMKVRVFQYRINRDIDPDSLRLDLPADTQIFDGLPQIFAPESRGAEAK